MAPSPMPTRASSNPEASTLCPAAAGAAAGAGPAEARAGKRHRRSHRNSWPHAPASERSTWRPCGQSRSTRRCGIKPRSDRRPLTPGGTAPSASGRPSAPCGGKTCGWLPVPGGWRCRGSEGPPGVPMQRRKDVRTCCTCNEPVEPGTWEGPTCTSCHRLLCWDHVRYNYWHAKPWSLATITCRDCLAWEV